MRAGQSSVCVRVRRVSGCLSVFFKVFFNMIKDGCLLMCLEPAR
jgi:hypothetical protein